MDVIFNIGVSGSGKSSWTKNYLKEHFKYLRLNRDDQRLQLVGTLKNYYQRNDVHKIENLVTEIQLYSFAALLDAGRSVIIDNTNLHINHIKPFIDVCVNKNVEFKFKFFDVKLKQAQNRVYVRDFLTFHVSNEDEFRDFSAEPEVEYIEKQYRQYPLIKKFILEQYPENVYKEN